MGLKERIKDARKKAGLTQAELAKLIGVGRSTVARYESGEIVPPLPMIEKIAAAVGVDAFALTAAHTIIQDHDRIRYTSDISNTSYEGIVSTTQSFMREPMIDYLCVRCRYQLEKTYVNGTKPRYYHIFNDSEDYMISGADADKLIDHISDHAQIDFEKFLKDFENGSE